MYPVLLTRALRPVPTLLGGSGHARVSFMQARLLPALLRPPVIASLPSGGAAC
jgi:hypothetical protein